MTDDFRFNLESTALFNERVRLAAIYVAIPINSIYLILDPIADPSVLLISSPIRLVLNLIFFLMARSLKYRPVAKGPSYLALAVCAAGAWSMAYFMNRQFYHFGLLNFIAGYVEIFLGVMLFVAWPSLRSMWTTFLCNLIVTILLRTQVPVKILTFEWELHFAVIFTIGLIAYFQTRTNLALRRAEFDIRLKLKMDVEDREKLVREKVADIFAAKRLIETKDVELTAAEQLSELAARVAHDIRSPLTALGVATADFDSMPDDRRRLVRSAVSRINDIANSLLDYRKKYLVRSEQGGAKNNVFALGPVLDRLVSEKRIEKSDKQSVRIDYVESSEQFGVFVEISQAELGRHLSNILNNAIQAVGDRGDIIISVLQARIQVGIQIKDTGKGMSKEVLEKLGQKNFSFGKTGGQGIGLYHAIQYLKSIGGDLSFESQLGSGTTVTMRLPRVQMPSWFLSDLPTKNNFVVIDDDSPILEVWQNNLKDVYNGKLHYFGSLAEFEAAAHSFEKSDTLYLVDYEFRNQKETGIDLIQKLGIVEYSVLVTSRFEDSDVISQTDSLGLRILPKVWIPYIQLKESVS